MSDPKHISDALADIQTLVDFQAEDRGLWFGAETAPEGYLQDALRALHERIEGHTKPVRDTSISDVLVEVLRDIGSTHKTPIDPLDIDPDEARKEDDRHRVRDLKADLPWK